MQHFVWSWILKMILSFYFSFTPRGARLSKVKKGLKVVLELTILRKKSYDNQ